MAESNADISRQPFVSRDVFLAAAAAYEALYKDDEGFVDATFQVWLGANGFYSHSRMQTLFSIVVFALGDVTL